MSGSQESGAGWRLDRARWKQVYDILREELEAGTYKTGFPIPSLSQLEQQWPDLARNTIRKAIARLEREGFVRGEVGVGTFVRPKDEWQPVDD
ncbi:winged helix-turn-helix domain-containing protein [Streptosporangium sp. NPDC051023]|uniref:winged helix-turn-helix domain-containing protein n=1 Tax=Streptosporangium sp. NPDC051023 TaxID=3155410 RepID=UPI00344F1103